MRLNSLHLIACSFVLSSATPLLFAQNTPAVDQAYTGATMVSGTANPGQAPVIVYDTTNSTRTALGTSQSVDKMGHFAAMVNAPLIVGHSIVVVDRSGAVSAAMVVVARPGSGSHQ